MDFKFTPEEQDIISMLRDFCVKELQPIAAELDEQERYPAEIIAKLAEMGMLGIPFSEEYGGSGLSYLTYIAVCEELAKYCASTSVTVSAHCSLCSWPISEFGTDEQKKKYLVPLATGEKMGAFGLTEPGAGTDAAMQKTTAVDKGDHWLINGNKVFITNGGVADIFVIFAMTTRTPETKASPLSSWRRTSRVSASALMRKKWVFAHHPPRSLFLRT
jgi:butyryl-CoA dehydrogenase